MNEGKKPETSHEDQEVTSFIVDVLVFVFRLIITATVSVIWVSIVFPMWIAKLILNISLTIPQIAIRAWRRRPIQDLLDSTTFIVEYFPRVTRGLYVSLWSNTPESEEKIPRMYFWREAIFFGFSLFLFSIIDHRTLVGQLAADEISQLFSRHFDSNLYYWLVILLNTVALLFLFVICVEGDTAETGSDLAQAFVVTLFLAAIVIWLVTVVWSVGRLLHH